MPIILQVVLGHEGGGVVESIGEGVTDVYAAFHVSPTGSELNWNCTSPAKSETTSSLYTQQNARSGAYRRPPATCGTKCRSSSQQNVQKRQDELVLVRSRNARQGSVSA